MAAIRICVAGAGGRMGQALIQSILARSDLALSAALDVPGSPALGKDAGAGVVVGSDIDAAVSASDVVVDFTRPAGTLAHLDACARHRVGSAG